MHRILVALVLTLRVGFAADEAGFTSLFDGKTLNGWKLVGGHGPGYVVRDNKIVCPAEGGGNLFTEKEYGNFVFRFEFALTAGATMASESARRMRGTPPTKAWRFKFSTMATRCTKARSGPNSITALSTM